MEFLLTYGWAVVVVVTAIGVWGYYFNFYPAKTGIAGLRPETCFMNVGLSCLDHSVTEERDEDYPEDIWNDLHIRIKNNLGFRMRVLKISVPKFNDWCSNPYTIFDNGASNPLPSFININNNLPALQQNQSYEIEFILTIANLESGLVHDYHGTLRGTVD